jgi:hypothetical protein
MDADERFTLQNLPETVEIYRGCTNGLNEDGISWTLNRDKAEFFANRYSKGGIILSKQISKKEILAVFNGRGEAEVICV